METVPDYLDLLDWRRRVFELYADVRRSSDPKAAWLGWRSVRDQLFATHPQSPVPRPDRVRFPGLSYFDYEPRARVVAQVEGVDAAAQPLQRNDGGTFGYVRFGVARFNLFDVAVSLEVYWLDGYGGGLFVPFRDATSGGETYGGGRYLLDSVKGADLGGARGTLTMDFNFAYHPSCVYDPQWSCPLAPLANRVRVPIRAGERLAAGPRRSAG